MGAPSPVDSVEHVVAGVIAGSVTAFLMSPLDVARTRLQLQHDVLPPHMHSKGPLAALRSIFQQEGVRGYFRGYSSAAIAIPLFWSTYFTLYDMLKRKVSALVDTRRSPSGGPVPDRPPLQTAAIHSLSAITAAVLCDFITNPLWVVRTRMQSQGLHRLARDDAARYTGLLDGAAKIVRHEGVGALYKGLVASWLGATHVAVQFPLYEFLKERLVDDESGRGGDLLRGSPHRAPRTSAEVVVVPEPPTLATGTLDVELSDVGGLGEAFGEVHAPGRPEGGRQLSSSAALIAAATVSKFAASAATYPHEVIRARLQDQRGLRYRGVVDCAVKIYAVEGVGGLYSGFSVNLLRALPATAIMFLGYEHSLALVKEHGLVRGLLGAGQGRRGATDG